MTLCRWHVFGSLLLASALVAAAPAGAVELVLRAEPGVAGPLGSPQDRLMGVGGGGQIEGGLAVLRYLDVQLIGGFLGLSMPQGDAATVSHFGAGARFQRPRASRSWSPWVDANALYVRTGPLDRFGFTVGAGIAYPLGKSRPVWLGLFARYLQVVQAPERAGYDNTDAKFLMGGISVEMATALRRTPADPHADTDGDGLSEAEDRCPTQKGTRENGGCPEPDADADRVADRADKCPDAAGPADNGGCPWPDSDGDRIDDREDKCPKVAGRVELGGCPDPDADGDGVPDRDDVCPDIAGKNDVGGCPDKDSDKVADRDDLCPDTAGEIKNHGCPKYLRVTVAEDKLELSQKVFFAYNGAEILERSYPLLDDVAQALKDHPGLRVRIEGHTDGLGSLDHNLQLSRSRAAAVRDYLVQRGVATDRLEVRGFGPKQPLASDKTPEGRERNRRVEFVIISGPR